MNNVIVSFADSTGSYAKKMQRLVDSAIGNFSGTIHAFNSYEVIGCEKHSVIPYKFKPYAIQAAVNAKVEGREELYLWCDSPVYAKKNLQPVFDHIEKHGYLFFDNIGFSLGDFTNDKTLARFGITRQESWSIPMIMACCMGFNFQKPIIQDLFCEYRDLANELYPGEWTNQFGSESSDMRVRGHRHDQSVMSCLIHKYKLKITKGQETFFCYESHREVMPIADSVCLFSG